MSMRNRVSSHPVQNKTQHGKRKGAGKLYIQLFEIISRMIFTLKKTHTQYFFLSVVQFVIEIVIHGLLGNSWWLTRDVDILYVE